ncbi:unnamed protein product, partial [Laminaria digitata]
RVRAVDSDKASRALEDASHLEITLQTERKQRAAAAAAATEQLAAADLHSRQQIEALKKAHVAEMAGLVARNHENAQTAEREADEILSEELARVRKHAAEQHRQWSLDLKEAAERERLKLVEMHKEEVAEIKEAHRAETQGIVEGAASAAACATESVAADMSQLREIHAREMAEYTAEGEVARMEALHRLRVELGEAAEATLVEAVRRLQTELDQERATAQREASEAREDRRRADEERDARFQEMTTQAVAAADVAWVTAVDDQQKQFDAEIARLSEAHGVAVKAAVEEVTERLRGEHERAMATAIFDTETLHRQVEDMFQTQERQTVRQNTAIEALNEEHARQMTSLRNEHVEVVKKSQDDAEARDIANLEHFRGCAAASKADSLKHVEALEKSHREKLVVVEERHEDELSSAIEAEKLKGKAELSEANSNSAAEIGALKAGTSAASAVLENQHRAELLTIRETHEAEIKTIVADAEGREKEAREEATRHQNATLAEAKLEADRMVVSLNATHKQDLADADNRYRVDAEAANSEAEQRRHADMNALEIKTSKCLAEENASAAATLVAEKEDRKSEISRIAAENKAEIDKLLASAESKRDADSAAAADALSRAWDEARAEHEASLAAVKSQHSVELSDVLEAHRCEIERGKRDAELAAAADALSRALEEARTEHAASLAAVKSQHSVELSGVLEAHRCEIERVSNDAAVKRESYMADAKEHLLSSLEAMKIEMSSATATQEARCLEEKRKMEAGHAAETDRVAAAAESRRVSDIAEAQQQHVKSLAEAEKCAAASISRMKLEHAEVASLEQENTESEARILKHSLEKRTTELEQRRVDDLDNSERRFKSTVDAVRKELAEEKATFVTRHLLDLRKVKEEGAVELARVSAAADERRAAQDAEAAAGHSRLKSGHLEELQAASFAATEARKAELDGFNKRLALTEKEKARLEDTTRELEEKHRCDLRRVDHERKEEKSAELLSASERHAQALATALAEANVTAETIRTASLAAQEAKFADTLQTERESHAGSISVAESLCATVKADAKSKYEALKSEHLLTVTAIKNSHRTKVEQLEHSHKNAFKEMENRLEVAELAAVEAQASADEFGTRAIALDEMLRTSVGSKEQELAGHRSRVAQLQAFVARREASLLLSSSSDNETEGCGGGTGSNAHQLSPAAARSVQQRVIDLRAMAAGSGPGVGGTGVGTGAGGVKVGGGGGGGGETGLDAFASTGLVEGLTLERYAEELEAVLVRATVEATAARQDHLEADMQNQSVTRQLVGLKLVHAQLRERLEDTQVKLEHKSQSPARRLLNSAARLAFEFAKPDRSSTSAAKSKSPKKGFSQTTPKALRRQGSSNNNRKSPLARNRGGAFRRSKSP